MSKYHDSLIENTFFDTQRYSILASFYKDSDIGGSAILFLPRYGVWVLINISDSLSDATCFGKNNLWKE